MTDQISQQEMNMAALYAICTNPDMVARNIEKLQGDLKKTSEALALVQKTKEEAETRHAQAKQVEDQNAALSGSLSVREETLKKSEQHWFEKDAQQKKEYAQFNAEKLTHAGNVRQLDMDRHKLEEDRVSLSEREAMIKTLEDQTQALNDEAVRLRDEHKARLDKLQKAAAEAAGG